MNLARTLHRLSARKVQTLSEPGRYADGGGLYFRITKHGARSWVFMTVIKGKRLEVGLGAITALPLASARDFASKMREASTLGRDPRSVLPSQDIELAAPLFGQFADGYVDGIEAGFKNAVHRAQWRTTLKTHAASLRSKPVDQIDTDDVLAVLKPIWTSKNETATRLRGRIERILDAAAAKGYREADRKNPAAWKGHLEHFLPRRKKADKGHHKAVPWREMPEFMKLLRARRRSISVLALQFVILTAVRTGEALGARAGEFDFDTKTWNIPAERMKAGVAHTVPLSGPALIIAKAVCARRTDEERVFALSNMALLMLLKDEMARTETVHGFRSSFRDWAGEATDYPRELAEMALAHSVGDAVEQAYRRGRAIEKRRPLMDDWAAYLGYSKSVEGKSTGANATVTLYAIVEPTGAGFSIYWPDLPGATSAADSFADIVPKAQEALLGHLDGEAPPAPSPAAKVAEIAQKEAGPNAFTMPIPVPQPAAPTPAPKARRKRTVNPNQTDIFGDD